MASMGNIYQKFVLETKTFLIQNLKGMIYINLSKFILDSFLYKKKISKLETQRSRNNSLGQDKLADGAKMYIKFSCFKHPDVHTEI